MKVHYINILMFTLPLNILVTLRHVISQKNPYITSHTPNSKTTRTHRSLCGCDIYMSNYDNDPEMKKLMENFDHQISERFQEYDERMKGKRQKCKEQCDKEIQKIILKDKIEKELSQHLSTLQTNITADDIPTCVCEECVADKMEKKCLKCTQNFGGIVAPSLAVLGGIAELAISVWKPAALLAAEKAAAKAGTAAGFKAGEAMGFKTVISGFKELYIDKLCPRILESFLTTRHYTDVSNLPHLIYEQYDKTCSAFSTVDNPICKVIGPKLNLIAETGQAPVLPKVAIAEKLNGIVEEAKIAAGVKATDVTTKTTTKIITDQTGVIEGICNGCHTTIIASIVAVLIIVLVMVIIYLVLRYRRKNKMKKKHQYIKLLKE
ncbi:PIR protein, putative [Plasmodium sp. gorilla clade G1]|nr:PIR protein, putative [Plasmodium sp. gorilla clade G1]